MAERKNQALLSKNRRSRRVKPDMIPDLDFVDDIALLSDQIKQVPPSVQPPT